MRTWSGFLRDFFHTRQSLEAFDSCPLKFYKRYYEGLRWDRLLEKEERAGIERGNDFHMIARRYFLGVDCGLQEGAKDYETLEGWLKSLRSRFILREDAIYLPEYKLRYECGDIRLEANFDLVLLHDGKLEIWDWKTHSGDTADRASKRERLEKSLQTMVYMFTAKERSSAVFGREFDFKDISMYYWQPEPSEVIAGIEYSSLLHERFGSRLRQLMKSMEAFDSRSFEKSPCSKHCKFCEFNWYCGSNL